VAKDRPLVVIGVPCYGNVPPEVLEDFARFLFHCGRRVPEFDFKLAIKTKSEQFRARNAIVTAALQVEADYLLMLDDDMIINPFVTQGPTDDYDLVRRLIAHEKDICGALYYQRGGACEPVLMRRNGDGPSYRFLRDEEVTHGPQQVDVAGGGCLMINMRIFDKIAPPYFAPEHQYGTDIQLCSRATEAGFTVWADTSIELGHLRQERATITSQNRLRYALSDPVAGEWKKQVITADVFNRFTEDACAYLQVPTMDVIDTSRFLRQRDGFTDRSDVEWYRLFPRERVARQVWFNNTPDKRQMTEFILAAVSDQRSQRILEFGCGVGILAYSLAERGHRVTACDVRGTGTLEFLKWRVRQHGVPMTFLESDEDAPRVGSQQYDIIIAMDSLEHVKTWRQVLAVLGQHLVNGGAFFANNGALDDRAHPEHYTDCTGAAFVTACAAQSLMPFNPITYMKRVPVAAGAPAAEATHESADSGA
jgi:SAM-dependent methyltransferase